MVPDAVIEVAREAIEREAAAVAALVARLDEHFVAALDVLVGCEGRVLVTGLGKSGHVARKIAATLSSLDTPAFFVHSGEALHGDAGVIAGGDVLVALSSSGETDEVCRVSEIAAARGVPVIAMTGCRGSSTLARRADIALDVSVEREADPLDLAPTASTTATMAMGDALAIALAVLRGFAPGDFARHHPGGSLGQRLDATTARASAS